jgi:hypothetical protein
MDCLSEFVIPFQGRSVTSPATGEAQPPTYAKRFGGQADPSPTRRSPHPQPLSDTERGALLLHCISFRGSEIINLHYSIKNQYPNILIP